MKSLFNPGHLKQIQSENYFQTMIEPMVSLDLLVIPIREVTTKSRFFLSKAYRYFSINMLASRL